MDQAWVDLNSICSISDKPLLDFGLQSAAVSVARLKRTRVQCAFQVPSFPRPPSAGCGGNSLAAEADGARWAILAVGPFTRLARIRSRAKADPSRFAALASKHGPQAESQREGCRAARLVCLSSVHRCSTALPTREPLLHELKAAVGLLQVLLLRPCVWRRDIPADPSEGAQTSNNGVILSL